MNHFKNASLLLCLLSLLVGISACGSETSVTNFSAGSEVQTNKSRVNGTVGTGTGISAIPAASKTSPQGLQKGFQSDTLLAAARVSIIGLDGVLKGITISDGRGNFSILVDPGRDYFIRVESGNIVLKSTLPPLVAGSTTGQIVNSRTTAVVAMMESALGVDLSRLGVDASDVAGRTDGERSQALDNTKLNETTDVVQNDILSNGDLKATDGSVGAESPAVQTAADKALRDEIAPKVISKAPQGGASDVAVNTSIQVRFSEDMLDGTLRPSTFFLKKGTQTLSAAVSYDPNTFTATLKPNNQLSTNTSYTVTLTTGVTDKAGNPLSESLVFSFTTGIGGDTTAPTIFLPTSPPDNALNVAISSSIQVTFSEEMDGSTVTPTTFTVTGGGQNIAGSVTYNASLRQATFTPGALLVKGTAGTVHTVTLKTGITDLAGNPLSVQFVFTFTTIADTIPPIVISNTPGDASTNVVVNTAIQLTFSEQMDSATFTSATFTLQEGTQTISGTPTYNPVTLTATFSPIAQLATNTSYIATLTTGVTDKAGNPLSTPFVFSFTTGTEGDTVPPSVSSTSPLDNDSGVAINTGVRVTFSEDMLAGSLTPTTFRLTVGGQNIAGSVSYNATLRQATFIPNLPLANGTLHTGILSSQIKDLVGNTITTQFVFAFTTIPDTTAPSLLSKFPADGSISIPVNATVQVTFSEDMSDLTLNTTTFTLVPAAGGATFPGTVSYNSATFTASFTPTGDLAKTTSYTVTLTTGVTDKAGNPLVAPSVFSFTTGIGGDTTAPTITSTSPLDNAVGVPVNTGIQVNFSEDMNAGTLTSTTFTVATGGVNISGAVSYNVILKQATFSPETDLAFGTTYTVTITSGVTDSSSIPLSANHQFTFTTLPDTTNPIVSIASPSNGSFVKGLVNITATASDNVGVTLVEFFDGALSLGIDTTSPYSVNWATSALASGPHTLTAVARDSAGNSASSSLISVTVDNFLPSVSIISPSTGNTVKGVINITATASDNIGVTRVEFKVDGLLKGSDSTSPFAFSLATTSLSNRVHTLTAVAHDAAGNSTSSSGITVTIDNSPPTVSINNPSSGSTVKGVINIAATAFDNIGVTRLDFKVDGLLKGSDSTFPFAFSLATTSLSNGVHTLTAVAHDAAGNSTGSSGITVTIDNSPPTVFITNPSSGSTVSSVINFSATAFDNIRVTRLDFKVDGAVKRSDLTAPFAFFLATTSLTNGVHTLTAVAHDAAGNSTSSTSVSVTVNNPTVSFSRDLASLLTSCSLGCHIPKIVFTRSNLLTLNVAVCDKKYVQVNSLPNSGLYQKLIGASSAGCRAHPGGIFASVAATLKTWIEEGTLNN